MEEGYKRFCEELYDGLYWVAYILRELGRNGRLSGKNNQS